MPITYEILHGGHYIHAVASAPVTGEEFVEYEIAHAIDNRIKAPLAELFEVKQGACDNITMDDMSEVIRRRKKVEKPPKFHRCAVVVSPHDTHAWNLARFYGGIVMLHAEESVIVFATPDIARIWLGVGARQR
ncbi:MAG: hypothetical protein PHY29_06290 [Syntrophales bacterium]|nr:hypothetical protein [Syntrophales bacterium]